jgi:hypothetical protein
VRDNTQRLVLTFVGALPSALEELRRMGAVEAE